jgi:hypothetical protein
MSETYVSRNAFAKLEGCDEKQVRRGIERGVLTVNSEGKLAVSLVGSGWRKPRRDSKSAPAAAKSKPASDNSNVRKDVRTSERMSERQPTPIRTSKASAQPSSTRTNVAIPCATLSAVSLFHLELTWSN